MPVSKEQSEAIKEAIKTVSTIEKKIASLEEKKNVAIDELKEHLKAANYADADISLILDVM